MVEFCLFAEPLGIGTVMPAGTLNRSAFEKAMSNNPLGDIQKVDVGIALAHFDLTVQESGIVGSFAVEDPGFETDDSMPARLPKKH